MQKRQWPGILKSIRNFCGIRCVEIDGYERINVFLKIFKQKLIWQQYKTKNKMNGR